MNAVLLVALYLVTSLILAVLVSFVRCRPSVVAFLVLTLIPLTFVGGGFLPQRVLAPTLLLEDVVPWISQVLTDQMKKGSSANNPLLLDQLKAMEPWRQAARENLLFNPAQGAGAVLLGNSQSAPLYPPEVVGRLLPPVRAATYVQAARLLVAAWGLFLLARTLVLSEPASVLAATAFVGCGFLQLWRVHPHANVFALAPWILFGCSQIIRRPGARSALLLAVGGALGVFAGHPETLLHIVGLALLLAATGALGGSPLRRDRLPAVLAWGSAAVLISLLLAAPVLLPVLENLAESAEWQERQSQPHEAVEAPLGESLLRLVPAVSHLALGSPLDDTWQGPENILELAGGSMGGATLVLLPVALAWRRRRRMVALWLAVGFVGLLVGAHFPWISKPFGILPLFKTSLLKRLSCWWAVAAAVVVGLAVERLRTGSSRAAVAVSTAVAGTLLVLVTVLVPSARTAAAVVLEAGGMVAAAAAALALSRRRAPAARSASSQQPGLEDHESGSATQPWAPGFALALLLCALLVPRAALFCRWVPLSSSVGFYPQTEAVRFVQERSRGWRVAGIDAALLPQSAAFFGLEDIRFTDPMALAAYEEFCGVLGEKPPWGWHRIFDLSLPALDFLGVRFLFAYPGMGERPDLKLIYSSWDAVIYENPDALPRLFVPERYQVLEDPRHAVEEATLIRDYRALAIAAGPGLPLPGSYANGAAQVHALEVSPAGRITAILSARQETLIATSQPAIPGWRLWLDNLPVESLRVNGAFLGALVPAGEHRLQFRYAPASWTWGLGLAVAGFLLALGCWWVDRRSPL